MREKEKEKLRELKKKIAAHKEHLDELDKSVYVSYHILHTSEPSVGSFKIGIHTKGVCVCVQDRADERFFGFGGEEVGDRRGWKRGLCEGGLAEVEREREREVCRTTIAGYTVQFISLS